MGTVSVVYGLVWPGSVTSGAERVFAKSALLEKGNRGPPTRKNNLKNSGNDLRRNKLIY